GGKGVACAMARAPRGGAGGGRDGGGVGAGGERRRAVDLLALGRGIDGQDLRRLLVLELVAVDADDAALPRLDLRLVAEGGLRDLALEEVVADRGDDPAELPDSVEVLIRFIFQRLRPVPH